MLVALIKTPWVFKPFSINTHCPHIHMRAHFHRHSIVAHFFYKGKAKEALGRGTKVRKRSKKPFQSGNLFNTISGTTVHQETGQLGYTFLEDNSVVECWRCTDSD